jgi:hypothetical protein
VDVVAADDSLTFRGYNASEDAASTTRPSFTDRSVQVNLSSSAETEMSSPGLNTTFGSAFGQDLRASPGYSEQSNVSANQPKFARPCLRKNRVVGPRNSKVCASKTVRELFVSNVSRGVTVSDMLDFLTPKVCLVAG